MAALTGGESCGAGFSLSGAQSLHPAAQLVLSSFIPRERPLFVSGQTVAAQPLLGKLGQGFCHFKRCFQSFPFCHYTIDQPDLQRLLPSHRRGQ